MNPVTSSLPWDASEEIAALIETLHKTEQRLEALTSGEVDTVTDGAGRTLLLRRAQEQMRAGEQARQAAILNALPAHIALLDSRGCIVSVNEAWRQFGRNHALQSAAFGIGLDYLGICDAAKGDDASYAHLVAAGIRSALAGEAKHFSLEYPCHTAEDMRWFLVTVTPLAEHNPNGVVVMHLDITGQKRDEDALRRFGAAMNAVADAIYVIDRPSMSYVYVNDSACHLQGRTREELLALGPGGVLSMPRTELERTFDEVIAGGKAAAPVELLLPRRDGSKMWIELRRHAQRFAGRWTIVSLVRNLTERKRLEEVHLQAQNLESLGTLAGGIAHDFNNILAAIQGNAALAVEDVGPHHPAALSLDEITKACARARELVRRITAFGRPKVAKQESVNLEAVVGEVIKLLRSTMPASISLKMDFAHGTPQVLADSTQIHEAVVNLTVNAAYAIGPHPGLIEYRLEPVQVEGEFADAAPGIKAGRYARLTVTDNGCGIDPATQERIFDAFYTTKPVGQGTGLGLSMVHGIMRSMDGVVTVESTPDKGTAFALYFPAAENRESTEIASVPAQSILSGGRRILHVDDEKALVFLANRALSRQGHQVSSFTDPVEALKAFRAHPQDYDVVVTDFSMPHLSGLDLARDILRIRPAMPMLMTTGLIGSEDTKKALEAGIHEVLLKPVNMNALCEAVERLFRAI